MNDVRMAFRRRSPGLLGLNQDPDPETGLNCPSVRPTGSQNRGKFQRSGLPEYIGPGFWVGALRRPEIERRCLALSLFLILFLFLFLFIVPVLGFERRSGTVQMALGRR